MSAASYPEGKEKDKTGINREVSVGKAGKDARRVTQSCRGGGEDRGAKKEKSVIRQANQAKKQRPRNKPFREMTPTCHEAVGPPWKSRLAAVPRWPTAA
jgi:hypothetical protein